MQREKANHSTGAGFADVQTEIPDPHSKTQSENPQTHTTAPPKILITRATKRNRKLRRLAVQLSGFRDTREPATFMWIGKPPRGMLKHVIAIYGLGLFITRKRQAWLIGNGASTAKPVWGTHKCCAVTGPHLLLVPTACQATAMCTETETFTAHYTVTRETTADEYEEWLRERFPDLKAITTVITRGQRGQCSPARMHSLLCSQIRMP